MYEHVENPDRAPLLLGEIKHLKATYEAESARYVSTSRMHLVIQQLKELIEKWEAADEE